MLYLSNHCCDDKALKQLFQANVMSPLELFQGISLIEALHAAIGLVKTSPVLVVIQQASRLFVMFGLCEYVPQVWDTQLGMIGIRMFLVCWTLSEVSGIKHKHTLVNSATGYIHKAQSAQKGSVITCLPAK